MTKKIPTKNHLFPKILWTMAGLILILVILALNWPAPLGLPADPALTPQTIKAAWFLLWIQELVSYSKNLIYLVLGLGVCFLFLPLAGPGNVQGAKWFAKDQALISWLSILVLACILVLTASAMFCRGPNWRFQLPKPSFFSLSTAKHKTGLCLASNHCLDCHHRHYSKQCTTCHRGNPWSSRQTLAHHLLIPGPYADFDLAGQARPGKRLIQDLGCQRCHLLLGQGNTLGPNLDQLVFNLDINRIKQALNGKTRIMPNFTLPPGKQKLLIKAIFKAARQAHKQPLSPYPVFFQHPTNRQNAFCKSCGPCHDLLSAPQRDLEQITPIKPGPNLTGLFTNFFPTKILKQRWTRDKLTTWVQNPRLLSPWATMPPQPIPRNTLREIYETIKKASPILK